MEILKYGISRYDDRPAVEAGRDLIKIDYCSVAMHFGPL